MALRELAAHRAAGAAGLDVARAWGITQRLEFLSIIVPTGDGGVGDGMIPLPVGPAILLDHIEIQEVMPTQFCLRVS